MGRNPGSIFPEGPPVLAFAEKGKKLAWGAVDRRTDSGVLKFYDLELTKEQQAELDKAYARK